MFAAQRQPRAARRRSANPIAPAGAIGAVRASPPMRMRQTGSPHRDILAGGHVASGLTIAAGASILDPLIGLAMTSRIA